MNDINGQGAADALAATNNLSAKWHVAAFMAVLAFVLILLYGVYAPVMNSMAENKLEVGDAFLARAESIKSDTNLNNALIEKLDKKILAVLHLNEVYTNWTVNGMPYDENHPLNKDVVSLVSKLDPDLRTMDAFFSETIQDEELKAKFDFLFKKLASRTANIRSRLDVTSGKPLNAETNSAKYYSGLCYTAIQDLLTTMKKIRDLYVAESCYDRAMAEYVDAVNYSRLSAAPRFHMAELYRKRGWPEFAMAEYAKVLRLAPRGELGDKAYAALKEYEGNHVEANYYIALAELIRGDKPSAVVNFRKFLGTAPANINAPKAFEVVTYAEAGNDIFLETFLNDEIWI